MTLAILDRWGRPIPEAVKPLEVKAITGPGAVALTYGTPLGSSGAYRRTPQQRAYNAITLYEDNDYIHEAEDAVSLRGGSVEWHLEDENEEEVTDDSAPNFLAVRNIMETPQAALPWNQRQPGCETSRGLWTIVLREMGLCGLSGVYLDQTESLAGTPLALLHIAPWRLYTVLNPDGRLLGWTLDKSMEENGTPVEIENLLLFYLTPPSMGYFGTGKVDAAWRKASLATAITNHLLGVIGAGGRLTGLLSPKEGSVVSDDNWTKFINDYRNITSDPNAAQRLQIVRGPVDYTRTAATPDELGLVATDERTQKAILALWGVPESQIGSAPPAGLNSGSTKGFDEAILWQGAIHPRLQALYETFQRGLLDRYKALGTTVELVIEEPSYDDDTPLFQRGQMAAAFPITNDERRELIGYEPFDENGPNAELGPQVWLPISLTPVTPSAVPEPAPVVKVLPPNAPPQLGPGVQNPPEEAKANLSRTEKLRRQVDARMVPKVKTAVQAALNAQRQAVVAYLEKAGLDHLKRKVDFRWDKERANRELAAALRPYLGQIVTKVAVRTHALLGDLEPAKASTVDDFTDRVTTHVLTRGAGRVTGINETTRDALQQTIKEALQDADTIGQVIDAVNAMPQWGEDRAELIARTESMFAYNDAALGSYKELGVEKVQAIDGDEDEECAARDGVVYDIDEAEAIEDHPNGTLDFAPVLPDEPAADSSEVGALEDKYHFDHEQGGIFDAQGRPVGGMINGDIGTIRLNETQLEALRNTPDALFTHSHPGGNVGFSVEDIQMASKYKLGEVRAVTETSIFRMRPGPEGWPAVSKVESAFTEVERTFPAIQGERNEEWSAKVWEPYRERSGGVIDDEGRALLATHSKEMMAFINKFYNDIWETAAKNLGLRYSETPR